MRIRSEWTFKDGLKEAKRTKNFLLALVPPAVQRSDEAFAVPLSKCTFKYFSRGAEAGERSRRQDVIWYAMHHFHLLRPVPIDQFPLRLSLHQSNVPSLGLIESSAHPRAFSPGWRWLEGGSKVVRGRVFESEDAEGDEFLRVGFYRFSTVAPLPRDIGPMQKQHWIRWSNISPAVDQHLVLLGTLPVTFGDWWPSLAILGPSWPLLAISRRTGRDRLEVAASSPRGRQKQSASF